MATSARRPDARVLAALRRLQIGTVVAGALLCIACPGPRPRPTGAVVELVEPPAGAQLQEPPASVRVRLRQPMDEAALAADWMQLTSANGPVPGTVSIESADARDLVWRPSGEWPRNEPILVRLSPAIRWRDGSLLGTERLWDFVIALPDATVLELTPPVSLAAGPSAHDFVTPARTPAGELAAVWWTLDQPVRQESAFRSPSTGLWSPPSVRLGGGVVTAPRTVFAGVEDLWLFEPAVQSCVVHQKLGPATPLSVALPRPVCQRLDDGAVVVWSASAHRLGLDAASLTWDPVSRSFVPNVAAAEFGADVEAFFGVLPFDGQRVQQIVRRPPLAGGAARLVAVPMDRFGANGAEAELLELSPACEVIPVANGAAGALLLVDQAGGGRRLRVLPFRSGLGFGAVVTLFSGLQDVLAHDVAVAPDGRVLLAVAGYGSVRVAEVGPDGRETPAVVLPVYGIEVQARIEADGGALLLVGDGGDSLVLGRASGRAWSLPVVLRDTGLFADQQWVREVTAAAVEPDRFLLLLDVGEQVPSGADYLLQELVVQLR